MSAQLVALVKPFASRLVKAPPQGKHGDYVSHSTVNEKLLAVLGPFDFEVRELIYNAERQVEGALCTLRVEVDGRPTVITEVGEYDGYEKAHNGDRAKKAASDAFKRCAMRLGVALHLWSGEDFFLYTVLNGGGDD